MDTITHMYGDTDADTSAHNVHPYTQATDDA
jgi:hypothetical protein